MILRNTKQSNAYKSNKKRGDKRMRISDAKFDIALANSGLTIGQAADRAGISRQRYAMILNQKLKGINIFRTVFFFPHVASLVAVAVVWNLLFHPTLGPINNILRAIGVANPPGWTSTIEWAMPVIIIVSIWKSMGYYMILYLSGLQAIPRELYEAAKVDGANAFQRFKNITLPMLTPTTFFVSIMLTIACFKVFDLISVMTNGGPGRATNVLVYHIYNTAFINYEFGYASAISMVLFAIVLTITVIQFKTEKKWVSYM